MAIIDFGGAKETVVTRKEFPLAKARKVLKNETIAVIGYGVQGPAQALNMKDNGFNVIIGQAKAFKKDWNRAVKDGWVPGKTLFDIEEAARARHDHPDARHRRRAARRSGPTIKKHLNAGRRALLLARVLDRLQATRPSVIPPKDVDVIMVAPKGSGTVRAPQLPLRRRASTPATPSSRTPPAAPRSAAWRVGIGIGLRLPLPDHVRARGLQRPDRRARRPDGRAGRRDGGAVRRAAQARPLARARPSTRRSRS